MKLNVDDKAWRASRQNKMSARQVSPAKAEEMRRQVKLMEDLGVIQRSTQASHSQVHLVAKPNNKFRFCIDFRELNDLTETEGGVIPNITGMIERIGRKQPKIFGIIDFTSGFHQALLHPVSRHYTAFITPDGLYEWVRVPMGIKGAPTYFQHNVGVHVLGNLLHTICELYIDSDGHSLRTSAQSLTDSWSATSYSIQINVSLGWTKWNM
jgi:hypothetical protein